MAPGAAACAPRADWPAAAAPAPAEEGCVTVDSLLADRGPAPPAAAVWPAAAAEGGGGGDAGADPWGEEAGQWGWDWDVSSPGDLFDLF